MEKEKNQILDALLRYDLHDDFGISDIFNSSQNYEPFVQNFSLAIKQRFIGTKAVTASSTDSSPGGSNGPVPLSCLVLLLCDFSACIQTALPDKHEKFMSCLIQLIPYFKPTGKCLCFLFDALRSGAWTSTSDQSIDRSNELLYIPLCYHQDILSALHQALEADSPPCISLPGDKESFLQLSQIPMDAPRAYTVSMWLKLPSAGVLSGSRGFVLYRSRSANAGVDALISSPQLVPSSDNSSSDNNNNNNSGNTDESLLSMTLTVRTSSERNLRDEVQCRLSIHPDKWHLITVKQTTKQNGEDRIVVFINGNKIVEADLTYPFITATADSQWMFGLGLQGQLASATLYADELSALMVQLLHSMGPYNHSLPLGARYPQSSFDTGHLILGTLSTKGSLATKACRMQPIFCITAANFQIDAQVNYLYPLGVPYPDHFDLQLRTAEHELPLNVRLHGNCSVLQEPSNVDAWMDAGGCTLLLYLVWIYCGGKFDPPGVNKNNSYLRQLSGGGENTSIGAFTTTTTTTAAAVEQKDSQRNTLTVAALKSLISLIAMLLGLSSNLKEQFSQLHGFHVFGHCLSLLPAEVKRAYIDAELIDLCIEIVKSLRLDAARGDGVAAALQGLLFDFRIWGECGYPALKHYLQQLASLMVEVGHQMYKYIGIQRILDIYRLYIGRMNPSIVITADGDPRVAKALRETALLIETLSPPSPSKKSVESVENANFNGSMSASTTTTTAAAASVGERKATAVTLDVGISYLAACADSVHCLLIIAIDAAHNFAQRMKISLAGEIEILLKCLEETSCSPIAERILRLVANLRVTSMTSLTQALFDIRYHETVVIQLLSKRAFATEVRSNALANTLWLIAEELTPFPPQLLHARRLLYSISNALLQNSSAAHLNTRKTVSMLDSNRIKSLNNQMAELLKPFEKSWLTLTMLAELISKNMDDGLWGDAAQFLPLLSYSAFSDTAPKKALSTAATATVNTTATGTVLPSSHRSFAPSTCCIELLRRLSNEGPFPVWLLLPLLPPLLARTDISSSMQCLMNINVQLKTNDQHIEVIANLPSKSWFKIFIFMAALGEEFCDRAAKKDSSKSSSEAVAISAATFATAVDPKLSKDLSDKANAATVAELALDCLAIVLEHKTRLHVQEAENVWSSLRDCLRDSCSCFYPLNAEKAIALERYLLTRCAALSLLRMSKPPDGWTVNLVFSFNAILRVVETRRLCGNQYPLSAVVNKRMEKNRSLAAAAASAMEPISAPLLDLGFGDASLPSSSVAASSSVSGTSVQSGGGTAVGKHSPQEQQVLSVLLDLMPALRRAAENGALHGLEWKALKSMLRVCLGCLQCVHESLADRIANEILAQLKYLTERWAPISSRGVWNILTIVLSSLRDAINSQSISDTLRGRYSALVFSIMHFFIEIRHSAASGISIAEQVTETLNNLIGIDNCSDISLIFKLMDVIKADAISFEEIDVGIDEVSNFTAAAAVIPSTVPTTGGRSATPASEPFIALKKETIDLNNPDAGAVADGELDYSILPSDNCTSDSSSSAARQPLISLLDDDLMTPPATEVSLIDLSSDRNIVPPHAQIDPSAATSNTDNNSSKFSDSFLSWIRLRNGISAERVDSERARLARSMDTLDLTSEATKKFWKKARRKVESESFLEAHNCQWKLGVAHEGHFFARRRIVLRPRFDHAYGHVVDYSKIVEVQEKDPSAAATLRHAAKKGDGITSEGKVLLGAGVVPMDAISSLKHSVSGEDLTLHRALAKACAGYIQDVTRSEHGQDDASNSARFDTGKPGEGDLKMLEASKDITVIPAAAGVSTTAAVGAPGTGWGLVDADGSEDGFGVIGLANAVAEISTPDYSSHSKASGNANSLDASGHSSGNPTAAAAISPESAIADMQGDVRQMEENLKHGKGTETGPCHSGTRRVGSGAVMLEARVILITASGSFWGTLSFNGKEIFFASSFEPEDGHKEDNAAVNLVKRRRLRRRRWVLASVSAIYMRRFRLRDSAMEVFFRKGKHRNFFVDFGHTKENARQRNEFARALMSAAPSSAFKQLPSMSTHRLVYDHGVQERWLSGELSNFEYLMALNTLAGRSYNDLCQYPVMPWVIADYTSETLDLSKESSYRDLSKPMGALNENRLREFLDRFNSFEENVSSGIPAFMYGSHYSTMVGVVLHFLVRLQPFAALHKEMQNGHFDVPDRLFSSVPRSFKHNTTQLSEVKELIPEWYTTPDMFRNVNKFPYGYTQDGELVDDVELPPWAPSPEEFVRINREALESDYVTEHLHLWVDLIFGYKQRGPDSVEAHNVFYYLTYYGSVNHYMIKDEALRRATELQIAHFGQTPMQLFKTPHPARRVRHPTAALLSADAATSAASSGSSLQLSVPRPLVHCFQSHSSAGTAKAMINTDVAMRKKGTVQKFVPPSCDEELMVHEAAATMVFRGSQAPKFLKVAVLNERILCVLDNGVVEMLKYSTSEEAKNALAVSAANPYPKGTTNPGASSAHVAARNRGTATTTTAVAVGGGVSNKSSGPHPSAKPLKSEDTFDLFTHMHNEGQQPVVQQPPMRRGVSDLSDDVVSNSSTAATSPEATAISIPSKIAAMGNFPVWSNYLRRHEALILVEREPSHFDLIPRVPVANIALNTKSQRKEVIEEKLHEVSALQLSSASAIEESTQLTVFNSSSSLIFTAGHNDGRISVREVDTKTGFVRAGAAFTGHCRRVISIASDRIPSGNTDVMASCDECGNLMIWTVLKAKAISQQNNIGYVLSRRPQRLFRCDPTADMCCDISWQLGVVAVISADCVRVFSIERDELVRSWFVDFSSSIAAKNHASSSSGSSTSGEGGDSSSTPHCQEGMVVVSSEEESGDSDYACVRAGPAGAVLTGPECYLYGTSAQRYRKKVNMFAPRSVTRHIVISDFGSVVVHIEVFTLLDAADVTATVADGAVADQHHIKHEHLLIAYSINGHRTGASRSTAAITHLSCPNRGELLVLGDAAGNVQILNSQTLAVLFCCAPHNYCVSCPLLNAAERQAGRTNSGEQHGRRISGFGSLHTASSSTAAAMHQRKSDAAAATAIGIAGKESAVDSGPSLCCEGSAIVSVTLGPNPPSPAVLCVVTESGRLYLKALPDFIKWERTRSPSALVQLANVPIQAMNRTIATAQNWTSETAGVLAQNARSLADDALGEIRKMQKNKMVKGVANFFGWGKGGGAADPSNEDSKNT